MLQANAILALHDRSTETWHTTLPFHAPVDGLGDFGELILAQHRANFDLWHQEDEARSPSASDSTITEVKHAIDRLNQQRNDLVEKLDNGLLALASGQNPGAPLHSETPGLIIDRLSILALKVFHTREEAERPNAAPAHHARNKDRLALLEAQRTDLAGCLDALWTEVLAGSRRFKLYRQMKMYNDPDLNPVLYRNANAVAAAAAPAKPHQGD